MNVISQNKPFPLYETSHTLNVTSLYLKFRYQSSNRFYLYAKQPIEGSQPVLQNRTLIYHGVEYVTLSTQKKLIQSFNQPDVSKTFKRYLLLVRISKVFAFVGSEAIAASIANASNLVGKKQRDEANVTISISGIGALGLSYFFYRQAEKTLQKVANSITPIL